MYQNSKIDTSPFFLQFHFQTVVIHLQIGASATRFGFDRDGYDKGCHTPSNRCFCNVANWMTSTFGNDVVIHLQIGASATSETAPAPSQITVVIHLQIGASATFLPRLQQHYLWVVIHLQIGALPTFS